MAIVHLLGRDWDIAPYKLGSMIKAAPFVDSQKARMAAIMARTGLSISGGESEEDISRLSLLIAQKMTTEEMMLTMRDAVSVLHVGLAKLDPALSVDAILDEIDPTPLSYAALLTAMNAVLSQGGLSAGESAAPGREAVPGASNEASATSSLSSSQPE